MALDVLEAMDLFRIFPFRYFGYAFTFGELMYIRSEDDGPTDLLTITVFYMAGHTLYLTALATVEVVQPFLHDVSLLQRFGYIIMTVVETLAWDCLASVLMPYTVGVSVFWIIDRLVCGDLSQDNRIRQWVPIALAMVSIPVVGPLMDLSADLFLDGVLGPNRYLWVT